MVVTPDSAGPSVYERFGLGIPFAFEAVRPLLKDARRRRFDVLIVWRLDRLGRNLRHLVVTLEDLSALGIGFVSLNEGIDATTPAGRLQMAVLGAIAQFERERIAERVRAGLARAKAQGQRLGRRPHRINPTSAVSRAISAKSAGKSCVFNAAFQNSLNSD